MVRPLFEAEIKTVIFKLLFPKVKVHPPIDFPIKRHEYKFGRNVVIGRWVILPEKLEIGDFSYIGAHSVLHGNKCWIKIGKYTSLAPHVKVLAYNHDYRFVNLNYNEVISDHPYLKGDVVIGNDVWVGAGATILPGIKVGDGAVIGAGAVITKDVEPYSIVVGNPAKRVKWRFPKKVREYLMSLKWWDWPEDKKKALRKLFEVKFEDEEEFINSLKRIVEEQVR